MRILGISAFYHDSAAALVEDGAHRRGGAGGALHPQEARRRLPAPRDRLLPRARRASASASSTTSSSTTSRSSSSSGCSRPTWPSRRAASGRSAWRCRSGSRRSSSRRCCCGTNSPSSRRTSTGSSKLLFAEHHLSHAASAFFPSPFEEAAVLTMDGVGEWATTSRRRRRSGNELEMHAGDPLPALARPALFRLHLLHRLQGQLRRVQGDGPRALRRAAVRADRSSTT